MARVGLEPTTIFQVSLKCLTFAQIVRIMACSIAPARRYIKGFVQLLSKDMLMTRPSWSATPDQLKVIERMAAAGMTKKLVCVALGISPRTMDRNQIATEAYRAAFTEMITQVGESAIQKSLHPNADTALLCFILKTRGGWREKKSYICIDDFDGDYKQKTQAIDREFREGNITIDEYKMLSDTINDRYRNEAQVEDHEKRLMELEKKAV